jgi:hypothetical protein
MGSRAMARANEGTRGRGEEGLHRKSIFGRLYASNQVPSRRQKTTCGLCGAFLSSRAVMSVCEHKVQFYLTGNAWKQSTFFSASLPN